MAAEQRREKLSDGKRRAYIGERHDVTVAILAIIVFVQTVRTLRDQITAYRLMESYEGFLRK